MDISPKAYFKKVEEIPIEYLVKNDIKVVILDVDNTLIDYTQQLSPNIIKWVENVKLQNIRLYILSNTNKRRKVEKVAGILDIPYRYFGMKPLKIGFEKIRKKLNIEPQNIAVVGDQVFTDILGGNRCNMHTILIEPINEKDYWYTAWKRPIENKIKQKMIDREER